MNAYLLLANGMVFAGQSVGAQGVTVGEVVFATGMVGFQETLTDPSYYGQIITQTYPLIGNYGMNQGDMESDRIWARGASETQGTEQGDSQVPDGMVASGGRYIDPNAPMVALTFDDGPYAPVGNRIMDCAEQYGGRVTFYVVGNRVNSYKSEIQRMYANGHEIGNHTQDHKYLQKLGAQEIRQQVEACNQAVAAITGEAPKTVRLPGGGKNSTVLANISQPIVLWDVDTLDWKTRNAASSVQTVLNQVKDGSVVLMHELYNASGDAAVTIIPALVERGYQLVTVSELAQFRGGLAGGTVYYSFHK